MNWVSNKVPWTRLSADKKKSSRKEQEPMSKVKLPDILLKMKRLIAQFEGGFELKKHVGSLNLPYVVQLKQAAEYLRALQAWAEEATEMIRVFERRMCKEVHMLAERKEYTEGCLPGVRRIRLEKKQPTTEEEFLTDAVQDLISMIVTTVSRSRSKSKSKPPRRGDAPEPYHMLVEELDEQDEEPDDDVPL